MSAEPRTVQQGPTGELGGDAEGRESPRACLSTLTVFPENDEARSEDVLATDLAEYSGDAQGVAV